MRNTDRLGKVLLQTLVSDSEVTISQDNPLYPIAIDLLGGGIISLRPDTPTKGHIRVRLMSVNGGLLEALNHPENVNYKVALIKRGFIERAPYGVVLTDLGRRYAEAEVLSEA